MMEKKKLIEFANLLGMNMAATEQGLKDDRKRTEGLIIKAAKFMGHIKEKE